MSYMIVDGLERFPATVSAAADVLDNAADYIETNGLWRDHYIKPGVDPRTAPRCTLGAINYVADTRASALTAAGLVADDLDGSSVPYWNDNRKRDRRAIVRRLRKVARKARKMVTAS